MACVPAYCFQLLFNLCIPLAHRWRVLLLPKNTKITCAVRVNAVYTLHTFAWVVSVSRCVYPFYLHQSPSRCKCTRGRSLWRIPPQPAWGLHTCLDPHKFLSQRKGLKEEKHRICNIRIRSILFWNMKLLTMQFNCSKIWDEIKAAG